jgi:hypothetical protein
LRQSLDTQTDALKVAGITRIFAEKISTRATVRPELERALTGGNQDKRQTGNELIMA